jgi:hypothetical protein
MFHSDCMDRMQFIRLADLSEVIMTENMTYLTTQELSHRIKYDCRTIRERLKDAVLIEGVHYIRPFGGRKILFLWERIEQDMAVASFGANTIPMANGGVCHG